LSKQSRIPTPGNQGQPSLVDSSLGTHRIQATLHSAVSNLDSSTSGSTGGPGGPGPIGQGDNLEFTIVPASVTSGGRFSVNVAYEINGQPDASATGPITLEINTGPAGGTLTGALTELPVRGVATFSGLRFFGDGSYTLKASAAGIPYAISPSINVGEGNVTEGVTHFGVVVSPDMPRVSSPITLIFSAFDSTNHLVTAFNGEATVQEVTAQGTVIRNLGTVAFHNGVAIVPDLEVSKPGEHWFQMLANGVTKSFEIAVSGRVP